MFLLSSILELNAFFVVWLFADHLSIVESPDNVTVNEREVATFNCTATGSGNLTIEWICSGDSNCEGSSERSGGYVTSILEIPGATNLTVTCVVNQNLISLSSGGSDVEVRLPPDFVPAEVLQRTAQLTVIPAPTTDDIPTQDPASTSDSEPK